MSDVVTVAPSRRPVTTRKGATAVPQTQRTPQRAGEEPALAADVQDLTVAAQHGRQHAGVAGEPADRARREANAGLQGAGAYAVDQLVERHGHHELRPVAAVVGQLAGAPRQTADLAQRVGAALTGTAVIVLTGRGAEPVDRLRSGSRYRCRGYR